MTRLKDNMNINELNTMMLKDLKAKFFEEIKKIDKELECMSKEQTETKELKARKQPGFTSRGNRKPIWYDSFKYEQISKDALNTQNKQLLLLNFQAEHDPNEKDRAWNGDHKHWFILYKPETQEYKIEFFENWSTLNVVYFSTKQLAEAALHAYLKQFVLNRNEQ